MKEQIELSVDLVAFLAAGWLGPLSEEEAVASEAHNPLVDARDSLDEIDSSSHVRRRRCGVFDALEQIAHCQVDALVDEAVRVQIGERPGTRSLLFVPAWCLAKQIRFFSPMRL